MQLHDTYPPTPLRVRGDGVGPGPEPARTILLTDGALVGIRTIRAEDAESLNDFHEHLSAETVYKRFLSSHRHLRPKELEWFTQVDCDTRLALVAERDGKLVGVARYDTGLDRTSAEVAFVIADELQGHGLGTLLLEHLAAAARRRGVSSFTADTLCTNVGMQAVFRQAGFAYRSKWCSELMRFSFPISPTQAYLNALVQRECVSASAWIGRTVQPALNGDVIAVCGSNRGSSSLVAAGGRVGIGVTALRLSGDPTVGLAGLLAEVPGPPVIVDLEGLRLPRRFLALAGCAGRDRRIVAFDPRRNWRQLCRQADIPSARWADEAVAMATRLRCDTDEWGEIPAVLGCDLSAGRGALDRWWDDRNRTERFYELPVDVATDLLAAYRLEYSALEPIWAGDKGGQLVIARSRSRSSSGLHKLLPLTDRDAFDLSGPEADQALRITRLLDDQPDVREIEVESGRSPRIVVGARRDTTDDPWVRQFWPTATEGSTISRPDECPSGPVDEP